MKIGIVGLPNVGKSTLFKALTKKQVDIQNYPFCTIDPNIGIVTVPDERLELLAKMASSKKIIPTIIEFVDIAGIIKGAHEGQGLGNKFLSHIREVDAIAEVVRIFEDENIIHVDKEINPLSDVETVNLELIFADLETINKRLEKTSKDSKRGDKQAVLEEKILNDLKQALENNQLGHTLTFTPEEMIFIKTLNLLTTKPIIYILNKASDKKNLDQENDGRFQKLMEFFKTSNSRFVILNADLESELGSLTNEEKNQFRVMADLKSQENTDELIKASYQALGLITFITTGEDETRAWTILVGSTAPQAGAAIHSDFEEKFIKADVINWQDLINSGSTKSARLAGLIRTEGKKYIVQDGDVIEFKI
ncbi:redox-regulated ATPase YchF [Candidatus Azambacteria bacterium]|nr:redox-regulated ATPase YchF [Candidatus Azambacteria bacterium]